MMKRSSIEAARYSRWGCSATALLIIAAVANMVPGASSATSHDSGTISQRAPVVGVAPPTAREDLSPLGDAQVDTSAHGDQLVLEPVETVMNMTMPLRDQGAGIRPADVLPLVTFSEGFENAFPGSNWTLLGSPTWDDESYRPRSGAWSGWCAGSSLSPLGAYANNMDAWMILGPFSLAGAVAASLDYFLWLDSEPNYDAFRWVASTDGVHFFGSGLSGNTSGWSSRSFNLSDVPQIGNLLGQNQVWVAFWFHSDGSNNAYGGAFVDDISLNVTHAPTTDLEALDVVLRTAAGGGGSVVTNPQVGQALYPTFTFRYTGSGTLAVPVRTQMDGSTLCSSDAGINVPPGTFDWVCNSPWTVTAGPHFLVGTVDHNHSIAETNEGNNAYQRSYNVPALLTPTPTMTASPTKPAPTTTAPPTKPAPTITTSATPSPTPTSTPPSVVDTTLRIGHAGVARGQSGVQINVTTSNAIVVGSTDLVLAFDPLEVQAATVSSGTLGGFTYAINNTLGEVRTASASASGDTLSAGTELFRVSFNVRNDAALGETDLWLADSDNTGPDDLGGVAPPVPPPAILYDVEPGSVLVGAGSITCSGSMTAADASVLLCTFVGRCHDGDFPPPCNDPATRIALSDWDCSGSLTPVDAQITLGIVVGTIRFADTPLVKGCSLQRNTVQSVSLRKATAPADNVGLEVSNAAGAVGDLVTVVVRALQAVEVGSTDLKLRYNRRVLAAVSAESDTLSAFTYGIPPRGGVVRTASATAERDFVEAGATLFRVTLKVLPGAARRETMLRIGDGDGKGKLDIAGPMRRGSLPTAIPLIAHPGRFTLVR